MAVSTSPLRAHAIKTHIRHFGKLYSDLCTLQPAWFEFHGQRVANRTWKAMENVLMAIADMERSPTWNFFGIEIEKNVHDHSTRSYELQCSFKGNGSAQKNEFTFTLHHFSWFASGWALLSSSNTFPCTIPHSVIPLVIYSKFIIAKEQNESVRFTHKGLRWNNVIQGFASQNEIAQII